MSKYLRNPTYSPRLSNYHQDNNYSNVIYNKRDFIDVAEIIENKFYFATLSCDQIVPKSSQNIYVFSTDNEFVYNNYYHDFGPLNIGHVYKYCQRINQIINTTNHKYDLIVHYTSKNVEKRTNAAFLVAAFGVLYLKVSPSKMCQSLQKGRFTSLRPFQDASPGVSTYTIKLVDCLQALVKVKQYGFFNFDDFNVQEYEKLGQKTNGDLHWIVPQKLIAFLGPMEPGYSLHCPEKYLNYFLKNNVTAVVRLNDPDSYESCRFTNAGINHYDMFFPDCSVPPHEILKRFLNLAESTYGAIAVHCKAGLGRTGTLIAAYIMKHYKLTAHEAIAWLRMCRPGSVVGQQQAWLEFMTSNLWRNGDLYRVAYRNDENSIVKHKIGIYSLKAKQARKKTRIRKKEDKKELSANKKDNCELKSSNGSAKTDVNKPKKSKMKKFILRDLSKSGSFSPLKKNF